MLFDEENTILSRASECQGRQQLRKSMVSVWPANIC